MCNNNTKERMTSSYNNTSLMIRSNFSFPFSISFSSIFGTAIKVFDLIDNSSDH